MASSILRKYHSDLVDVLTNPDSIAMTLHSRNVITYVDMKRVTKEEDTRVKAALLLNLLEIEAMKSQDAFYEFLQALRRKYDSEKVSSLVYKMETALNECSWSFLTLSDLYILVNELYDVVPKWHSLGIQLRLDPGTLQRIELQRIESQYSDSAACLREALIAWLKTTPNPTWKELIDALKCPSVGEFQLAQRLDAKFHHTSDTKSSQSAPEPCLKDLMHLPIAPYWYELGLMLGLSSARLDHIETDHQASQMRCAIKMFDTWLRNSPNPTFEQLTMALLQIGQKEVAEQITKEYGLTPAAEFTKPPAKPTELPVKPTEPPAEGTEPPAEFTELPAKPTEPPAEFTEFAPA